jgi:hypothetical protein
MTLEERIEEIKQTPRVASSVIRSKPRPDYLDTPAHRQGKHGALIGMLVVSRSGVYHGERV